MHVFTHAFHKDLNSEMFTGSGFVSYFNALTPVEQVIHTEFEVSTRHRWVNKQEPVRDCDPLEGFYLVKKTPFCF